MSLVVAILVGINPAPASADPWSDFWAKLFSQLQPKQPQTPSPPTPTTTIPSVPDTKAPTGAAVKLVDFGLAPVANGYQLDTGAPYSAGRGYGWETLTGAPLDLSSAARDRNAVSDQRLDSLIHMDAGQEGRWQLDLRNGTYLLTVGTGDPSYTDSRHIIRAEGKTIVDFKPTQSARTNVANATVTVADSRLTLDQVGGDNTKLLFLDVRATESQTTTPTTAPPAPTTTVPPTTAPPAAGVPGPVGGPGGTWRPIFNEEFNGNAINRSRFPDCHWATRPGCTGQQLEEMQVWKPENTTVSGGAAHLTARPEPTFVAERGKTFPYTSGLLSTGPWGPWTENSQGTWMPPKPTFDFKYGYVEGRIKVAPGKGVWSAFWLEPSTLSWPPEVDIMEAPNFKDNELLLNLHSGTVQAHKSDAKWVTGPNWSADYHTYAVDWTPRSMTWYIDGRAVFQVTDPAKVPQVNMYVIANLCIGAWAGPPTGTAFPKSMDIDYIRVWQR